MRSLRLDSYVLDSLMPELVGRDRVPSAFLVYLALWNRAGRRRAASVEMSHRNLAEETGLSKSGVQHAVAHLSGRRLIAVAHSSVTATPRYTLLHPWRRRS